MVMYKHPILYTRTPNCFHSMQRILVTSFVYVRDVTKVVKTTFGYLFKASVLGCLPTHTPLLPKMIRFYSFLTDKCLSIML